jgi:hypothetical protein
MAKTEKKELVTKRASWLLWAGMAALVILLGHAFVQAWRTNQALRTELDTLQPMVTAALGEQSALEARLAYVQSDEYVESWSKTRAKMALPGETLVVTINKTPTPSPVPVPIEGESTPDPSDSGPLGWMENLLGQ